MNTLIGISGKIRSGKDTVVEMFQELNSSLERKAFADKVKLTASILSGIPVEKFHDVEFKKQNMPEIWDNVFYNEDKEMFREAVSVRTFLQKIGTDALRNGLDTQVWMKSLFAEYIPIGDNLLEGEVRKVREEDLIYPDWIISDVRFKNEAREIKRRGGILIRVERNVERPQPEHLSETALDYYEDWDYIIHNTGTLEDLRLKIKSIYEKNNNR